MNINDEMNITIHKNDILNLIKILPNDENLEISYNDREILFAFKGFLYKTKLVGTFLIYLLIFYLIYLFAFDYHKGITLRNYS